MNKYDLMSGPIFRRCSDFIRSEEDVVPKLYKRNIAFQTAVRNDKTSLQMDSIVKIKIKTQKKTKKKNVRTERVSDTPK